MKTLEGCGQMKPWTVCLFVCLVSLVPHGLRAEEPDAKAILGKVQTAYGYLRSYDFKGTTTESTTLDGKASSQVTHFEDAFSPPNKFLVVYHYPTAGDWIRVSDGSTLYRYRSLTKQVQKTPVKKEDVSIPDSAFVLDYLQLQMKTTDPKLTGSDTLTVDGQPHDCYVVEGHVSRLVPSGTTVLPTKWWIDKKTFLVLRQVEATSIKLSGHTTQNTRDMMFTMAQVNQTVPDTLFAFKK
jgi:outer membrane lipoprotein-sorting protein